MAEMNAAQRQAVTDDIMDLFSFRRERVGDLEADILTSVGSLDTWLNDEQGTINNLLASGVKNTASVSAKIEILNIVLTARNDNGVI